MKIKQDFITNSSSASFVLYVESTLENINDFKIFFEEYSKFEAAENGAGVKRIYNKDLDNSSEFDNYNILQIGNNKYKIIYDTSMYNGFEDIPSCIINILIKNNMLYHKDNFYDIGLPKEIKSVKFEIIEGY